MGNRILCNSLSCGAKIGDFFIHNKSNGAFKNRDIDHVKQMSLVKIIEKGNIEIDAILLIEKPEDDPETSVYLLSEQIKEIFA